MYNNFLLQKIIIVFTFWQFIQKYFLMFWSYYYPNSNFLAQVTTPWSMIRSLFYSWQLPNNWTGCALFLCLVIHYEIGPWSKSRIIKFVLDSHKIQYKRNILLLKNVFKRNIILLLILYIVILYRIINNNNIIIEYIL